MGSRGEDPTKRGQVCTAQIYLIRTEDQKLCKDLGYSTAEAPLAPTF